MSGVSDGQSQPRPCSGTETLRRCRSNVVTDNVILIDVEGDDFDNVIVIDVPESLSKKLRRSSPGQRKRSPWKTVICIDEDESSEDDYPDDGANENGNLSNGASSSPTGNDVDSDAVDDECQFVQENISPVKLSKCRRTYSGNAPPRNHYGLGSDSEIDSADDDFPDCELVEDSFGEFREKWEKASLKRKCENRYAQSGIGVRNNISRISPNSQQDIGAGNMPGQHKDAPHCSTSGKRTCEGDEPSPSNVTRNSPWHYCSCDYRKERFADSFLNLMSETRCPNTKTDVNHKSDPLTEEFGSNYGEKKDQQKFEHGGPSSPDSGQGTQGPPFKPQHEEAAEQLHNVRKASEGKERTPSMEAYTSNNESGDKVFCNGKASSAEELHPGSTEVMEEEELEHAKPSSIKTKIYDEKVNHDFAASSDRDGLCRSPLSSSGVNMDKGHHQENVESFNEKLTSCSDSGSNEDDVVHDTDGHVLHGTESCIISDREKLKETDEYKRAIEGEWAARQQALQIQAEEAQQLRQLLKRRKAERMRLLDMERRQKQRLEEMRETQKKDEEHMNLKELMRAEIRRELSKLELECHDMASLLRSLGITFGSELKPLPHEVRAACKRALFTFHPDRASKFDTRQQVESEEKFKLVSRMKEKFLLT